FDLEVIVSRHSLKGADYLYEHHKARGEDLMMAFSDKSLQVIIANIGGSESIRLLPYIDFEVIRENPIIFMRYSDTTLSHLFCHKAGLSSFYGSAIMVDFAENVEMDPYTIEMENQTSFSISFIGR